MTVALTKVSMKIEERFQKLAASCLKFVDKGPLIEQNPFLTTIVVDYDMQSSKLEESYKGCRLKRCLQIGMRKVFRKVRLNKGFLSYLKH